MGINEISGDILDAAIKVHRQFGPGLLESVYEKILAVELEKRGHKVECQKSLPLTYEDRTFTDAFRIDILVDQCVVVELKSTTQMLPVYFKQLKTYLVLSKLNLGLLINFGMNTLKEGFKRVVNNLAQDISARGVSHAECAENAEDRDGMAGITSASSAVSARGKSHAENAENAECREELPAITSASSAVSARGKSHAECAGGGCHG